MHKKYNKSAHSLQVTTYSERREMVHNIKRLAKEQRIPIAELEERASVRCINRWDRYEPSVYKVLRVAQVLGTTVEAICEED